jgi:hypothetical protein
MGKVTGKMAWRKKGALSAHPIHLFKQTPKSSRRKAGLDGEIIKIP